MISRLKLFLIYSSGSNLARWSEIIWTIFRKLGKMSQNLSSDAVVIGSLRVKPEL